MIPLEFKLLATNWTFKKGARDSTNQSYQANNLPTEIYRDLIDNSLASDPFIDLNELYIRWVADETWTYQTVFDAPPHYDVPSSTTVLCFGGLDTFAAVYLNGSLILESDNAFKEYRIRVSGKLLVVANKLEIEFASARKRGLELVEQHREHRFIVHQTEISRGPVRKPQYHWGWDWGPILLTCGPWKPISLETYSVRITDIEIQYELSDDLHSAKLELRARCEGSGTHIVFTAVNQATAEVVMLSEKLEALPNASKTVAYSTTLDNIKLWWPRGLGDQNTYTLHVDAYLQDDPSSNQPLHSVSQRFGFRKVELVQEPDEDGTSFYFRINNLDIFCGGSCFIPADSFLSRVDDERYIEWVGLAVQGNQNMLRVWGGGIYEADAFYNAADELGILVWQDFTFACASYPANPEYLKNVEEEAIQNVKRLRNHPSLVCWAGNNEDYQIVERYNLEYRPDKDPRSSLDTDFPARYIYEYMLPNIIDELCKTIPYVPSSPFGNGKSNVLKVDPTIGDVHQWNVWHGTMEPYQRLPDMGGRFISEFGMEAFPHVATLRDCITNEHEFRLGSATMDFRNKAIGHDRRLVSYVAENFALRTDLPGFTHLTQVMQADAMTSAYRAWRRQWGVAGRRKCGGVLVWQMNDCWPTVSWAVVDYQLVPKPAYYAIKRAMRPRTVGIQRHYRTWTARPADQLWQRDTGHLDPRRGLEEAVFDVWVANSSSEQLGGEVVVRYISIRSGDDIGSPLRRPVVIEPNGTTDIIVQHLFSTTQESSEPFDMVKADPFVIFAELHINGAAVATDTSWPDPIKYLTFEKRDISVRTSSDGTTITVTAGKPVKGFVFQERPDVRLSDNGFDVMPGEKKEVNIEGCRGDELEWMYVGCPLG